MQLTAETPTGPALDVWFRFTDPDNEQLEAEASTFPTEVGFVVQWNLAAVGLVKSVPFDTLDTAREWLAVEGFTDFTA